MSNVIADTQNQTIQHQSTPELGAWILPVGLNSSVAIGRYELKYIEHINSCVTLPGLPAFCEQGFLWRDQFIPVLDLQSLITRRRIVNNEAEQLAAIIAYENAQGELAIGALLLHGVPKLINVRPGQSVAIGQLANEWQLLAQAAFQDDNSIYPVLDLRCLFDKTPVDLLSLH